MAKEFPELEKQLLQMLELGDMQIDFDILKPKETSPEIPDPVQPGRCGAKTRSGKRCNSYAVSEKRRCRMHGGAPGSGAPKGNKNAKKHGLYCRESLDLQRTLKKLMRECDAFLKSAAE